MNLWLVLILAGAGTLALRLSFILAAYKLTMPAALDRAADLVFPVAMAAILGASLHGFAAAVHIGQIVALALAATATALVSRFTGSVLAALVAGLTVMATVTFAMSALG
jgi:branched-subunit amino acid transport protein